MSRESKQHFPIHRAALIGYAPTVELYLSAGVPVNALVTGVNYKFPSTTIIFTVITS